MSNLNGCIIVGPDGTEYQLAAARLSVVCLKGLKGKDLGDKISSIRKKQQISQRKFASKVGITHAQLNKIENGKVEKPHSYVILAIERELSALPGNNNLQESDI